MRGAGGRPRRLLRAAAALAAAAALGGCISERQELQIGNQLAAQVNTSLPLVRDTPTALYVNALGRMIARQSARPDLPYRFYVVDSPEANAFALPGGHIYVHRGLIERTQNVSELAGVLAHEIAHVAARHGAEKLQRQLRAGSMLRFLSETILGGEPLEGLDALEVGAELRRAQHSRQDEAEADELAVGYLRATGVDPEGIVTLFDQLAIEEAAQPHGLAAEWFATHPRTEARIAATRRAIDRAAAAAPDSLAPLATDVPSYAGFLARLRALPPSPLLVVPGGPLP